MSQFDDETRLSPAGEGRYSGRVHSCYNIGGNPNGGYLMALAVSALRDRLPQHPDPVSIGIHYLRPGIGDEACEVQTEVIRAGRSVSTARATLLQQGVARLEVLATMGALGTGESGTKSSEADAVQRLTIPMPSMPPPEQCVARSGAAQGITIALLDRLDIRLHPDDAKPGLLPEARLRGWIRFLDGREPDPFASLLFADAFPPAVFGLLGVVGWVPTIELTVHLRSRPAPGWVLGQFSARDLDDGRLIEDGLLWDSTGRLIAQCRQLAMLLKRS